MSCLKKLTLGYLFACTAGQKDNSIKKIGIKYSELKSQIRPLDLILFKGNDFISRTILDIENELLGNGDWSHCGLVLTTDVVPIKNGIPGQLYIWESTFDLVKDVELDDYVFGVQIRSLDDVIREYNKPRDTQIGWCKLKNNPLFQPGTDILIHNMVDILTNIYQTYNHLSYDYNPCNLMSTVAPKCATCCKYSCGLCCCMFSRGDSDLKSEIFDPASKTNENEEKMTLKLHNNVLFVRSLGLNLSKNKRKQLNMKLYCSELVALTYIKLGIFPSNIQPHNIAPVEFLGHSNENKLPIVINGPILIK